ncbi:MAG TPA: zf-HC2 domain-containing protein [Planctomycetaceae bacterium]|nr:zf-HC2 domain-containing protein [Planctomycetaceae bacterium]
MPEHPDQNWTPCEGGEISEMVIRLKQIRRKVAIQKTVTATVCVLALITVGTVFWNQQHDLPPLSHQTALELLPEYHAGRLDAETAARMKTHLAHCESCRVKLRELNGEESRLDVGSSCDVVSRQPIPADSLFVSLH